MGEGSGTKMKTNKSITNKTGPGLCLTARKNPSISPDGFISLVSQVSGQGLTPGFSNDQWGIFHLYHTSRRAGGFLVEALTVSTYILLFKGGIYGKK